MKSTQKTFMLRTEDVSRDWHMIDVADKVLGRVAVDIAAKLIGKFKPNYTPHVDGGDFVVVLNSGKVVVTADKAQTKKYFSHSGFPGGAKSETFATLQARKPEDIIVRAVKNMLPKNKLRDVRLTRLKVYPGIEHPHQAQIISK